MDKKNIKRIIAREGLIILALAAVAYIFSFMGMMLDSQLPRDRSDISPLLIMAWMTQENWPSNQQEAVEESMRLRNMYPEYNELDNLNFAKSMAERWQHNYLVFESLKANSNLSKSYEEAVNYKPKIKSAISVEEQNNQKRMRFFADILNSFSVFILYWGFPVYLVIRFIIWALRILRERCEK